MHQSIPVIGEPRPQRIAGDKLPKGPSMAKKVVHRAWVEASMCAHTSEKVVVDSSHE